MNQRIFFLVASWVFAASPARSAADLPASPATNMASLRVHVSASVEPVVVVPAGKFADSRMVYVPGGPMNISPGAGAALLGVAILMSVGKANDSPGKRAADEWRFELGPVLDSVPEFDIAGQIGSDLGRELKAAAGSRVSRVELGGYVSPGNYGRIAAGAKSDGVLFVDVTHAIAADGFAGGPTYVARADYALASRDGEVLISDAVEFVAPHSAATSLQRRVAWWAGERRYFTTLQLMSAALAKTIVWRLYGASDHFTNETPAVHSANDFLKCDDFQRRPVASTSFAMIKGRADGPAQVGIICE
jgi:hypothetical protein